MTRNPKKYLFDIVDAITLIETYLASVNTWTELAADREKTDAVERRLGIIGEALWKLRKGGTLLSHSDWAINFRNTLIHQYDEIGTDTLWYHIQHDLPDLKAEAEKLLS